MLELFKDILLSFEQVRHLDADLLKLGGRSTNGNTPSVRLLENASDTGFRRYNGEGV